MLLVLRWSIVLSSLGAVAPRRYGAIGNCCIPLYFRSCLQPFGKDIGVRSLIGLPGGPLCVLSTASASRLLYYNELGALKSSAESYIRVR